MMMRIVPVAARVLTNSAGVRLGKWAPLFAALERNHVVLGVVEPRSPRSRYLHALETRLPSLPGVPAARSRRWTKQVGARLRALRNSFEWSCSSGHDSPPTNSPDLPFVVYTDNTLALTLRHYRPGIDRVAQTSVRCSRSKLGRAARHAAC